MDRSDAELVEQCLAGGRDTFVLLVERHQDAVYNLAYRMTGNAADAADLAQEAFIRAFRKLDTYKAEYSFRNWVLGICANRTRNLFRGNSRRRRLEEEHAKCHEQVPEPDRGGAGDERGEWVERALQEMPENLRVPLVLKYGDGLSNEEIERALGLGASAVKMRLLRGRDELARRVREWMGRART